MVQKSKKATSTAKPADAAGPRAEAAAAGRALMNPSRRSARRWICSEKAALPRPSLDDLSAATGMNRPSLYGAFGDKRELYIKSYAPLHRADARAAMVEVFKIEAPIRERLRQMFAVALEIYLSGEEGRAGCFTVMTAASEAVADPEIRAFVLEGLQELDRAFASCFRTASNRASCPLPADPKILGHLAFGHDPHPRHPVAGPDTARGIGSDRDRCHRRDVRRRAEIARRPGECRGYPSARFGREKVSRFHVGTGHTRSS